MKLIAKVVLGGALAVAAPAVASAATLQMLGSCLPTDLSADGSVIAGNLPSSFETFRWTQSTGIVPLGRATVPTLGIGAGSPDISWDGTKISASILSDAGTQMVGGQWTLGSGWRELGPMPPNSVPEDNDVGDAWGQSGDGNTVVGLYWVANSRSHGYRWTSATGAVDLGAPPNQSSRANAASYNGSVIGGWEGAPGGFPGRLPTVWVNGVKTVLGTSIIDSEVSCVNGDGTVVGGNWRDAADPVRGAAIWRFNGATWDLQELGTLPGTVNDTPGAIVSALSADGNIAVGFNRFNIGSQFASTGFYWTQATGMISANQLISNLGLTVPAGLQILDFTSISADGFTIAGVGFDGGGFQGFRISVPEPSSMFLGTIGVIFVAMRRRSGIV